MLGKLSKLLGMRRLWLVGLAGLFISSFFTILALPPLVAKAQISEATIIEILDGNEVFIENKEAQVNDNANLGQRIHTKKSRTALEFNNGAQGRLGSGSEVTVGQCIEVHQGAIIASGPANGCLSGFIVNVQGTIYLMEAKKNGKGNIKVLEGEVEITPTNGAEHQNPFTLRQGQKLKILGRGLLGPLEPLTPEEFANIIRGKLFQGFQVSLHNQDSLPTVCQQLFPNFACPAPGNIRPRPRLPGGIRLPF